MNYFDVLLAKKLEDTRDPVVKGLSVTENGRYSEENTVYDVVVVDVPETRLTTLNATANGTYTPQEGEAYNEVNVDVPLPSNAYLLKSLTGLPQDIATFTDGADAPLNALTASIDSSCAGADIIVSESEIINNKTPYIYRRSAGGDRVYEKLIGGTIAWNQLVQNADTSCTIPILRKYIARIGGTWSIGISDGTAITVDGSIRDMVFDLTQMLGSTIADYIYSLEQTTAGAGVAWFRALFPNDYYAYDSGTLQSVNVASKKVYDSNNTLVATYTFDSDLTLRGIPKLDANNNLYYDGDVYESNGTVTRKYGIVDLGSLTWVYEPSGTSGVNFGIMRATLQNPKLLGDLLCTRYVGINTSTSYLQNDQIIISGTIAYPFLRVRDDAYTDATAFKTAMSGVYLVYELATPTTESADPYINPQIVDADGTEEFVDYAYSQSTRDVAVPVGHDSYYYDGTLYSRDFPTTISSGSYDIINGVITSGQNTYNTTPLPLRSLVGNNNIYVDCGDVTNLEYFAKEQHE